MVLTGVEGVLLRGIRQEHSQSVMHPTRERGAPGRGYPGGAQRRIGWLYVDGLHGAVGRPIDDIGLGRVVNW